MTGYQMGNIDTSMPSGPTGAAIGQKVEAAFGGIDWAQKYQNALTENNRAYEKALLQEQMNYNTWFDSTATQRRVEDLKAAGLNPWLALQSGGISANGSSGSQASPGSGSSAKQQSAHKSNTSSLAMLLLATAKLISKL